MDVATIHDHPRPVPGLHHPRRRHPEDLEIHDRVRYQGYNGRVFHGTVVHLTDDDVEIKLDIDGSQLLSVPRTELKEGGRLRRIV